MTAAREEWLWRAARLHPDRVAVDAPDGRPTYAELEDAVDARMVHFVDTDVFAGDRVAIDLPSGVPFAIALHACWALHWVAAPIDPRWPAPVRAARLATCTAVIGDGLQLTPLAGPVAEHHVGADAEIVPDVAAGAQLWPAGASPEVGANRAAAVVWTSGSTGPGTEVTLTFGNLLWNAIGSAAALGQPPHERWLSAMPVAHVGGLTVLARSAIGATTAVLRPRFDQDEQLALLMAGEATITSMVPTMLSRLLDAGLAHPPNLRLVLLGGGPIPPALTARAAAAGVPVAATYGLSEASSQVFTAGAPLFCTHVALRGERHDTADATEDPAAAEEILVRGPTLARGVADADGWLATGDRGRRLPDGTFTVVGRLAETIVTGGENVAPTEVEALLVAQPGIADAAVLGIDDPEWGERIEARVVLTAGATLDEAALRDALRAQLPGFAVPKAITAVDALPRTPTGKLIRRELR